MSTRLFAGRMSDGSYRIRIAKKGRNAASLATPVGQLQFDSAWTFGGSIHAMGRTPNRSITFPALPYIPMAYVLPWGARLKAGAPISYDLGNKGVINNPGIEPDNIIVTDRSISVSGGQHGFAYFVFRIPTVETNTAGKSASNTPRLLIGRRGGSIGAYISRPNYRVDTCPETQLLFSTDRTLAGIKRAYHGQFRSTPGGSGSSGGVTIAIPNQGFIPIVFPYVAGHNATTMWLPQNGDAYAGILGGTQFGFSRRTCQVDVTKTTIKIYVDHDGGGALFFYSVIVLDQPGPVQ